MRIPLVVSLLLVAACSNAERMPGGESSEEALELWLEAVRSSDYDAAAALMAPGYRDRWLVYTLALLPAFGQVAPEVTEGLGRIQKNHGFTLDGLTYRSELEDQHLDAIRERLASVGDREALLADVLRSSLEMCARVGSATGYPEDRGREPDWAAVFKDTRTVEVDGRWFVVLELPSVTESEHESR